MQVRADTVVTRSLASGSRLAQFRSRPSAPFVAPTFADSPTGTLLFGGLVAFEQAESTTIPVAHGRLLPLARGVRDVAAMRRYAPAGSFTAPVFADARSGTLIFAGSSGEGKTGSDSATGTLIWGGSRTESATFTQTASGTLIFSGSAVQNFSESRVQIAAFIRIGP